MRKLGYLHNGNLIIRLEEESYNQGTVYLKFELISKLFNLAIAVAVVYEKYISCLGSFCPTTQGVGGGGVGQQKFRISPEQPREGRSTIVHIPPPFPSCPVLCQNSVPDGINCISVQSGSEDKGKALRVRFLKH